MTINKNYSRQWENLLWMSELSEGRIRTTLYFLVAGRPCGYVCRVSSLPCFVSFPHRLVVCTLHPKQDEDLISGIGNRNTQPKFVLVMLRCLGERLQVTRLSVFATFRRTVQDLRKRRVLKDNSPRDNN